MDTYSREAEALFYACEGTIARYNDELASYLSSNLKGGDQAAVVEAGCKNIARCGRKDSKKRSREL